MKRLFSVKKFSFPSWAKWACALGFIALLYLLKPILSPFIAAAIVAYIVYPPTRWLTRHGVPQSISAIVIMLCLTLIILVLLLVVVPLFIQKIMALMSSLPVLVNWLQTHTQPILDYFSIDFALDNTHIRDWLVQNTQTTKAAITQLLSSVGTRGMALVTQVANWVLFPLVLFYFLRDGESFVLRFAGLIPRRYINKVNEVVGDIDRVLGEFLRSELLVMLIMSAFYSGGLWAVGLDAGLPIGIIAGLLVFIPYVGAGIGISLATLAAFVQFGTIAQIWPVWAVFLAGQLCESYFITPKLVGDRIGLHPVMIIFALLAFGQLFGFVGLLLALPLAAIIHVSLSHVLRYYRASKFYRDPP